MNKPLKLVAVVVAVAALSVLVWQQTRIARLTQAQREAEDQHALQERLKAGAAPNAGAASASAELERLRASESALKVEVARLRAALTPAQGAVPPAGPAGVVDAVSAEPDAGQTNANALSSGMKGLMRGVMEQQYQGQLARMKERLKLTPPQEEAIRSIHARQIEQAGAVAEKMFSGKLTREEMAKAQGPAGNPESEIRALLDPEQLVQYDEYKREEAASNARLVANAELLQMQSTLGLSQEQQDQVFNALYDASLDQLTGKTVPVPAPGSNQDPASAYERVVEQKVQALSGVLTPEQLSTYRDLQRQQMDMIKSMLPAAPTEPAKPQ